MYKLLDGGNEFLDFISPRAECDLLLDNLLDCPTRSILFSSLIFTFALHFFVFRCGRILLSCARVRLFWLCSGPQNCGLSCINGVLVTCTAGSLGQALIDFFLECFCVFTGDLLVIWNQLVQDCCFSKRLSLFQGTSHHLLDCEAGVFSHLFRLNTLGFLDSLWVTVLDLFLFF